MSHGDAASMGPDWRRHRRVLVVEARTLGALAVIRSLGRAGYEVHAAAAQPDAIGLASTFASHPVVHPAYGEPTFLPWLRGYVDRHRIQLIVPSEGLLLAIRTCFGELADLLPFSADERTLYAGLGKFDLFSALGPAAHVPPTLLVEDLRAVSMKSLERLGRPLYVKTDGIHSRTGEHGTVRVCADAVEALHALEILAPRFSKATVQGHVAGQGVGAFFLIWDGEVLAEFMHRRLHEVPYTGGVSSLRESWYHPGIREDALAKLRRMNWRGVAMMEYRFDAATQHYDLMEMNGRFWGSLHLALAAGVDFPRLLADAFFGRPERSAAYPVGLKMRHLPLELQHVWSRLKAGEPGLGQRTSSVLELVLQSLDPRVGSDLRFPGDRLLELRALGRFARESVLHLGTRLRSGMQQPGGAAKSAEPAA